MLLTLLAASVLAEGGADDFQLEDLLDTEIETNIGKVKQRTSDVAGALTVLRGEVLRERGYTSVAQALELVPGFFLVSDLSTVNVGVRGVVGGAGSAGNIVKVLIDGNPVSFLPTNGNFFAEELIPLDVVERIEVLRSPSSALFGANAFLGVINIVTRTGDSLRTGALLTGSVGLLRSNPQLGGSATVSGTVGDFEALASFQQYRWDRSGLALPSSSPALGRTGAAPASAVSADDLSNPQSIFGRLVVSNVAGGRLSVVVSQQQLDSGNQFLGFAPLQPRSHLRLVNQGLRLEDQRSFGDRVDLRTGFDLHRSVWDPASQVDLGNEGELAQAQGGAAGFSVSSTASIRVTERGWLTVGADFTRDGHDVLRYATVRTAPLVRSDGSVALPVGAVQSNDPAQSKLLWNVGGLLQGVVKLGELVTLNAGARIDGHNIYGLQFSPRAGVVVARKGLPFTAKLLFSSAFKAPSAVELYGRPLTSFDLIGNATLKPQYARSFELLGSYRRPLLWSIQASVFATSVEQLVTYLQTTKYFEASNGPARWFFGGELELEWTPLRELAFTASGSLVVPRLDPAAQVSALGAAMPIFPALQGRVAVDWAMAFLRGAHLSAQLRVVGPRLASESNAVELYRGYALPTYAVVSASAALLDQRWLKARKTSLKLRVDNLLDTRFAEAGYGGVDLPALGRSVMFTVSQEL